MNTDNPGQFLSNISIGLNVGITTRERRYDIQKGIVKNILTRSAQHTHGIMVELESGVIGRVKEIYSDGAFGEGNSNAPSEVEVDPLDPLRVPLVTSIAIEEDSTGYSYEKLFLPYIKDAKQIVIEDAYIRLEYQIKNLVYFCSILPDSVDKRMLKLITSYDNAGIKLEQERKLLKLKSDLDSMNIYFEFDFDNSMHDRSIIIDDKWKIVPGRGLDIFKDTGSFYSPATFDQTKRKCKRTEIHYIKL